MSLLNERKSPEAIMLDFEDPNWIIKGASPGGRELLG